jgi:hypothetical protein
MTSPDGVALGQPSIGAARPPPRGSTDRRTPALDWAVHYAVPLSGVAGVLLYGVLRLAYVFFYLRVRTTPEEVGFGYTQILASEVAGAVELVAILSILFCLAVIIGRWFGLAVGRLLRLFWHRSRRVRRWVGSIVLSLGSRSGFSKLAPAVSWLRTRSGFSWVNRTARPRVRQVMSVLVSRHVGAPLRPVRRLARLALRSAVVAVAIVAIGLPWLAWREGGAAADGFTVRNLYVSHLIRLPVLAVQAVPASVSWTAGGSVPGTSSTDLQCLLYLGAADGVSVFYDVQHQESLRLPTANIVLVLEDWTSVKVGC